MTNAIIPAKNGVSVEVILDSDNESITNYNLYKVNMLNLQFTGHPLDDQPFEGKTLSISKQYKGEMR